MKSLVKLFQWLNDGWTYDLQDCTKKSGMFAFSLITSSRWPRQPMHSPSAWVELSSHKQEFAWPSSEILLIQALPETQSGQFSVEISSQVSKSPQKPMFSSLLNHEQVGVSEQAERHSYWSKDSPDPISYKKRDRSVILIPSCPCPGRSIRDHK